MVAIALSTWDYPSVDVSWDDCTLFALSRLAWLGFLYTGQEFLFLEQRAP